MVATWALCADTQEEAESLATSSRMALFLLRTTGKLIRVAELMIVTITHSHEARRHSYQRIAEAFGTNPRIESRAQGARIASQT